MRLGIAKLRRAIRKTHGHAACPQVGHLVGRAAVQRRPADAVRVQMRSGTVARADDRACPTRADHHSRPAAYGRFHGRRRRVWCARIDFSVRLGARGLGIIDLDEGVVRVFRRTGRTTPTTCNDHKQTSIERTSRGHSSPSRNTLRGSYTRRWVCANERFSSGRADRENGSLQRSARRFDRNTLAWHVLFRLTSCPDSPENSTDSRPPARRLPDIPLSEVAAMHVFSLQVQTFFRCVARPITVTKFPGEARGGPLTWSANGTHPCVRRVSGGSVANAQSCEK